MSKTTKKTANKKAAADKKEPAAKKESPKRDLVTVEKEIAGSVKKIEVSRQVLSHYKQNGYTVIE